MKTLLSIFLSLLLCLNAQAQTPVDTADLRSKINAWIVPNGNKQVSATQVNQLLNGITNLMGRYSLNSAYRVADTLFLTGPGLSTVKVTLNSGGAPSETDPSVPSAIKALNGTDITRWNGKQDHFNVVGQLDLTANVLSVNNSAAAWNANKLQGRNIASSAPAIGQVLKWNGSAWAPAADDGTSGGSALPVGGNTNQFLTKNSPADGDAGWLTPTKNIVGLANVQNVDQTNAANVTTGTFDAARIPQLPASKILQSSAITGQVLKWNGTEWAPATDNNSGGSGLPTGGNTNQLLIKNSTDDGDAGWLTPSKNLVGLSAVQNVDQTNAINVTAGIFDVARIPELPASKIGQSSATTGQVLKWNGSAWAPAADNNSGGGGLPAGGTTSQALLKNSTTDGDASWNTLSKSTVGLPNVDNTSDINKPISTATQAALDAKQAALVAGSNIKTIDDQNILGNGNLKFYDSTIYDALNQFPLLHNGIHFNSTDTVYFFGDSYVAGSTGPTSSANRWTTLLASYLGAVEANYGEPGSTLMKRTPIDYMGHPNMIDRLSLVPTKASNKKLIVFAYGLNDVGQTAAAYTIANFKTDYDSVLHYVTNHGWDPKNILIIPPYYIGSTGYAAYATITGNAAPTATRHLQFVNATKEVATKWKTQYFDIFNDQLRNNTSLIVSDGIHANDEGNSFIFKDVAQYLAPIKPVSGGSSGDDFFDASGSNIYTTNSGNVGFGTSSPSRRLEVYHSTTGIGGIQISNPNAGSSAYSALVFGNDASAAASGFFQNSSTNAGYNDAGGLAVGTFTNGSFSFLTNNTLRGSISSSGVWNIPGIKAPTGLTYNVRIDDAGNLSSALDGGSGGGSSQWTDVTNGISYTGSANASIFAKVINSNSGTGAVANLNVQNNLSNTGTLGILGGGYTTSGLLTPSTVYLYGGKLLLTSSANYLDLSTDLGATYALRASPTTNALTASSLNDGTGVAKMVTSTNGLLSIQTIPGGGSSQWTSGSGYIYHVDGVHIGGTSSPARKLQVTHDVNGIGGALVSNPNAGSGAFTMSLLGNDESNAAGGSFINSIANTTYAGAGGMTVGTFTNRGLSFITNNIPRGGFDNTGALTVEDLSGTGNRMVVASSTGKLSTQTIPTGGSGSSDLTGGPIKTNLHIVEDADYTVASTDYVIIYKSLTTGRTLTLPDPALHTNRMLVIKHGGQISDVTLSRSVRQSSTTTTNSLTTNKAYTLISDGTEWWLATQ